MQDGLESGELVQSVVRAFDILKLFSAERRLLGVSDVAALTRLNRTTAHRLIATLRHCGMLIQDPVTHRYGLSAQVLQFSSAFVQTNDLRSIALAPMAVVRDTSGETCGLHVREGGTRVIIAQVESRQALRLTYPNLGEAIPLHLGAPGKAMLAFFRPVEIDTYLRSHVLEDEQATPFSVTDPDQLRRELEVIHRQGYAVSQQERRLGVVSIAAPVFDKKGVPIASLNVSGPIRRLGDQDIEPLIASVVRAADEVSRALLHLDTVESGQRLATS